MEKLLLALFIISFALQLEAQFQVDIQGHPDSTGPVANIKVNFVGAEDVVGLKVTSIPHINYGTAGAFYGSYRGVVAAANSGIGVVGLGTSAVGGYFQGPIAAIELGGSDTPYGGGADDCVIRTERGVSGGDLILVSNDEIVLHLNDDNSFDAGHFAVLNSSNNEVMNLDESGNLQINQMTFQGIASTYSSTSDPDDGVIKAPAAGGSDLYLVSNDDVAIHLDDNGGSTSFFQVFNGANSSIFSLDESGNLTTNGKLDLGVLGTGGGVSVCLNSAGELSSCSSSLRYKSDVQPFMSGYNLLSQLQPVTFRWKASGQEDLGFVAEEVARAEPLLTTSNAKGQVEGVKYDRIGLVIVNTIKEQHKSIQDLEKENEELRKMIHDLSTRLELLENL